MLLYDYCSVCKCKYLTSNKCCSNTTLQKQIRLRGGKLDRVSVCYIFIKPPSLIDISLYEIEQLKILTNCFKQYCSCYRKIKVVLGVEK